MGKNSQTENDKNLIGNDFFVYIFYSIQKLSLIFLLKSVLSFGHVSVRNIFFFLHFKFILVFILDKLCHSETTFYNVSYKESINQNEKL